MWLNDQRDFPAVTLTDGSVSLHLSLKLTSHCDGGHRQQQQQQQ